MSNVNNLSGNLYTKAGSSVDIMDKKITELMEPKVDENGDQRAFTEMEMMELNMAVSQRTTVMTLFSSAIKNLTDTEKQVANKI